MRLIPWLSKAVQTVRLMIKLGKDDDFNQLDINRFSVLSPKIFNHGI